jgi:hypothetical protein
MLAAIWFGIVYIPASYLKEPQRLSYMLCLQTYVRTRHRPIFMRSQILTTAHLTTNSRIILILQEPSEIR